MLEVRIPVTHRFRVNDVVSMGSYVRARVARLLPAGHGWVDHSHELFGAISAAYRAGRHLSNPNNLV